MQNTDSETPITRPAWRLRAGERRGTLFFGDLIVAIIALLLALYFWTQGDEWLTFSWRFLDERVPLWFYLLPLMWLLFMVESYDIGHVTTQGESIRQIGMAASISLVLYLIAFFLSEPGSLPRRGVIYFIGFVSILMLLWRTIYVSLFTAPEMMRRVLIVGAGRSGSELAKIVKESWPPPFYLVGLVDDDANKTGMEIFGFKVLGSTGQLFDLVRQHQVSDLIFAISGDMEPDTFQKVLEAEESGIEVTTMPVVYEELLGRVPIFLLRSDWVLRSFVDEAHVGGFHELAKRLIDIAGGLVGTVFLIVTIPFIGTAILLESGTPIFYTQTRLGKNGRPYRIIKYRSMVKDAEKDGVARPAMEHDQRTTFVGRFLRKAHLDELPQFINVLKGEMSLVGPRSERPEIVTLYQQHIPFYRARLFVKPGLTGWAQVNFGYASDVEANAIKLEYDLYYIKHRSILLDFNILIRTIGHVVGLRGR